MTDNEVLIKRLRYVAGMQPNEMLTDVGVCEDAADVIEEANAKLNAVRSLFIMGSSAELCEDTVAHWIRATIGDFNEK